MSKNITIMDVALFRGVKESEEGGITLGEFNRVGLHMFGGCQICEESLAAYNMYPSTSGYVRCRACINDHGFPSTKAFEAWCAYQDALEEVNNLEENNSND